MSEEQLVSFLKAIKSDATLRQRLKNADIDTIIRISTEYGSSISAEEIQEALTELSDDELESMTDGTHFLTSHGVLCEKIGQLTFYKCQA